MKGWVLVTGSAKRIGRAIALGLAKEGCDIVLHYHKSAKDAEETAAAIKKCKRKVHLVKANFASKKTVEEFIPSIIKEIGPLTALVNNASLFQSDAKAPGGHEHRTVNLEAPLLLGEAFRKQLPPGKHGSIVNILDGCMPERGFTGYAESKKALRAMTIEMARRMAPNIRVNGVSPGPVLQSSRQSAEHFKKLVDTTLLKATISPEAIADAVRFLLENPSITGEIIHIDGGIRLKNTVPMTRLAG